MPIFAQLSLPWWTSVTFASVVYDLDSYMPEKWTNSSIMTIQGELAEAKLKLTVALQSTKTEIAYLVD